MNLLGFQECAQTSQRWDPFLSRRKPFRRSLPDLVIARAYARFYNTWGSTLLRRLPPSSCNNLWSMLPLLSVTTGPAGALLYAKHGEPLSVLRVSKRGMMHLGFQNLGETLLGVL